MARMTLDIAFKYVKDGARVEETRTFTIDSDDMPLILAESMDSSDFGMMREAITEFLGLTEAESRQLTVRHLKQIGAAMKEAQKIPNE